MKRIKYGREKNIEQEERDKASDIERREGEKE